LSFLRGKYPNAHLVGALSPMLSDGYPEGGRQRTLARQYIEGAVDARIAVGDKNVEFFEFDLQTGESGYGCDYHPNVTTQKAMSAKLVAALRSSMGW
jgi:hypothetical protein